LRRLPLVNGRLDARRAPLRSASLLLFGALACASMPSAFPVDEAAGVPVNATDASLPTIENAPPALAAIAHESRGFGAVRVRAHRDVLAGRLATSLVVPVSVPLRTPTLGIVVQSCHPLLRWCIAHATATSPA
jgi:hypothetical protein